MSGAAATGADRAERRVLVVGEALIDLVQRADGSRDEAPGGSPANVALTLGRLGRHPQLLTSLGEDDRGHAVRTWLEDSGVQVSAGSATGAHTSTATALLDAAGAATYEFDLAWAVDVALAGPADVLHIGSIATVLEPGASDVARLVEARRATATITFDPNIRPALIDDAAAARSRLEQLVRLADVVKVSDEDLLWLHPDGELADTAASWLAAGPAVVVVTQGGEGAFALTAQGRVWTSAPRVTVVDTVGAGDTFMGALVDGLIDADLIGADRRAALRDVPLGALESIMRRSAEAAAVTVSRPGADPPTRAELAAV
ncbi:carbohydrate kinase family protein [Cryobacterium zongtaii]|uniref:carbohydrate kinase family protein n=1 Tax=Cryobacterium zongtaii TaxID=1259217 RepID=UPI001FCBBBDD|nr:carbohydrate kinase [Cryobacterium zongtaii]